MSNPLITLLLLSAYPCSPFLSLSLSFRLSVSLFLSLSLSLSLALGAAAPRSQLRPLLTQSETPAGGGSQLAVPRDDAPRELCHAGQLVGQLIPSGAARRDAARRDAH